MKLPRRNFLRLAAGAAALPAVSRIVWAQAYPSRPVRIIAPTAPVSRLYTTPAPTWPRPPVSRVEWDPP